jgi:hypothetical protein
MKRLFARVVRICLGVTGARPVCRLNGWTRPRAAKMYTHLRLILRHRRIDLIRPGSYSAFEVDKAARETSLL